MVHFDHMQKRTSMETRQIPERLFYLLWQMRVPPLPFQSFILYWFDLSTTKAKIAGDLHRFESAPSPISNKLKSSHIIHIQTVKTTKACNTEFKEVDDIKPALYWYINFLLPWLVVASRSIFAHWLQISEHKYEWESCTLDVEFVWWGQHFKIE